MAEVIFSRVVKRWFARAVIFSIPAAVVAMWLVGNYRLIGEWSDPKWVPAWLIFPTIMLDLIAIFALLGLGVFFSPRIVHWLWRNAELTRRPDRRA